MGCADGASWRTTRRTRLTRPARLDALDTTSSTGSTVDTSNVSSPRTLDVECVESCRDMTSQVEFGLYCAGTATGNVQDRRNACLFVRVTRRKRCN